MADNNTDPKSSFVVLYLLIVLLGLTLAVTVYVFSHKTDMFPVYVPVAPSASMNGYSAIETRSTGKLPIRLETAPLIRASLDMSEKQDAAGQYTITLKTASRGFSAPAQLSVFARKIGEKDDTSFSIVPAKTAAGVYTAKVKFPSAGAWSVDVKIVYGTAGHSGARTMEFSRTFDVK